MILATLVVLKVSLRFRLLELLDELHIVLQGADFALVSLLHARVLRRHLV